MPLGRRLQPESTTRSDSDVSYYGHSENNGSWLGAGGGRERTCQPQLPLAAPLKDLADRWARELDAARATLITRVNSQEQFRW